MLRSIICLLLLPTLVACSVQAQTSSPPKRSRKDQERIQALLVAHNKVREQAKLPPLTLDPKLNAAALVQAADMAEHGMMSHEGTDGSKFNERIDRQGYRYKAAAENVAFGQKNTAQVMKSWMNSPHHKQNILGPYAQVGFGVVADDDGALYWCVDFATPWRKPDVKNAAAEVVASLNRERTDAGHLPLRLNLKLVEAAEWGAKQMASSQGEKSSKASGESIVREVKSVGYSYRALAQSAGAGQSLPTEIAKAWLENPAQRKIILGDFQDVGVAVRGIGQRGAVLVPHFGQPRRGSWRVFGPQAIEIGCGATHLFPGGQEINVRRR